MLIESTDGGEKPCQNGPWWAFAWEERLAMPCWFTCLGHEAWLVVGLAGQLGLWPVLGHFVGHFRPAKEELEMGPHHDKKKA